MPAPRVYRTEAIVLKAFDLGEADRILTLYTPDTGKLRAVAKGVRRTKSRMSGHLDLFTRSALLLARGRQLDIITQAESIATFPHVRVDLVRAAYASYIAELVDAFTAEGLANRPIYDLAVTTLERLARPGDLDLVVRVFEVQLLGLTGYRPQLHRCLVCEETIAPVGNYFSARLGGVLCPGCRSEDSTAQPITVPVLKTLRNLQTNESAMLDITGLDVEVRREVERRLHEYVMHRLESRPRSLAFLDRLRAEGAIV